MSAPAPITPLPALRAPGGGPPTAIIVLGGAFDPPHRAHVLLPRLVRDERLPGAAILYVPAAQSPLKGPPGAGDAQRLAMLGLALEGVPGAAVWTDELDRAAWQRARGGAEPSYTLDTLDRLRLVAPAGVPLRLFIGSDQAADFHRWREPRAVIALAEPLVVLRAPHARASDVEAALRAGNYWSADELAAWRGRVAPAPVMDDQSTRCRAAIARGDWPAAEDELGPRVSGYIKAHALYRAGAR